MRRLSSGLRSGFGSKMYSLHIGYRDAHSDSTLMQNLATHRFFKDIVGQCSCVSVLNCILLMREFCIIVFSLRRLHRCVAKRKSLNLLKAYTKLKKINICEALWLCCMLSFFCFRSSSDRPMRCFQSQTCCPRGNGQFFCSQPR